MSSSKTTKTVTEEDGMVSIEIPWMLIAAGVIGFLWFTRLAYHQKGSHFVTAAVSIAIYFLLRGGLGKPLSTLTLIPTIAVSVGMIAVCLIGVAVGKSIRHHSLPRSKNQLIV